MTLTLKIANQSFRMTLQLKMMHHNTKFGNKMFCNLEDIIWIHTDILTLVVTLTLNAVIHLFHKALWLMMMYYQTKFGCQKINSSKDIEEKVIFWSCKPSVTVTSTMKIANILFAHDTLAPDAVSPYQVWQQNVLWPRRYHPDKHWLTLCILTVTLTLNAVIKLFHWTLRLMILH